MNFPLKAVDRRASILKRQWSVRTLLICLVVACLLPGIIAAVAILIHDYRQGHAEQVEDTRQTARALAQAMDNQILQVQALAHGLATADSLARGDLARFHARARRVLEQTDLGTVVMLVDADGSQLANTGKKFGETLPRHANPEIIRRVFETGKPVISDLFTSAVFRRPVINVAVPVRLEGKVAYAIAISVLPQRFNAILSAQGLPSGWVATILDSSNSIVARSREAEKYAGEKPADEFVQRRGTTDEGAMEFVMKDGVSVLSVYTRSSLTNWSVAINIPLDAFGKQLAHRLTMLALSVTGLFAVGLGLAWLVGGKIAASFQALRAPALALGLGKPVSQPHVAVQEAAEVAKAMGEAAALLTERTAALRQTEIRLQTLTAHAPAAIAIFDRDMHYLAVSRRWCEQLRISAEGLIGKSHYDIFPDIPDHWKEAHRRGLAGEVVCSESDCFERRDGSLQWLTWELWPWYDDAGSVGGIVIASEDITRRKEVEMRLQESETRFRLMADCAPTMIWLAGTDRLCHWFNQAWLAFTGRTMQQECGNGWAEGVHPEDIESCLRTYEGAFERRENFAMEYRLRRHDGEYRWIIDHGAPRFDAGGTFAGYVGTSIDITERKSAQEAIERINVELESRVDERTAELLAANRELEGFTFAASHDLRGPLGRINSFSALLERQYRERLDGNGLVYLDFIRQNATRLTQLVDDLLSHARVAQQALELQPVDVQVLAQSVVEERADEIRETGANVRLLLPPAQVRGDPHAITQALSNLLSNALKYSASARPPVIEIGGRASGDRFHFWVKDNGIGFDMAYHDRIFEIFRRLHTNSEYEGSGVGLALVKRAIERIGGRVWAESRPGAGATFFVELQAADEAAA